MRDQPKADERPSSHAARPGEVRPSLSAASARPAGSAESGRPAEVERNLSVKGRIHIADEVVEKVAALAALEVSGVADLGGDVERAIESVRERIGIGNKRGDQGVKAEIKGQDVRITVTVMVEYGHVVLDVAHRVQSNVAVKTQRMLGLNVVEVNVTVDDVRTTQPTGGERAGDAA